MSCTYEEALQIEEDFLAFAQQVKKKNASKASKTRKPSNVQKHPHPTDQLENLCKLLDKLVAVNEEKQKLQERVAVLEQKDELNKTLLATTFLNRAINEPKYPLLHYQDQRQNSDEAEQESKSIIVSRRRRSSSGSRTWNKVKEVIRKSSGRSSPVVKVASPESASSIESSFDNIVNYDPYAEMETQQYFLNAELWSSVKRSSSYTQVNDYYANVHPKFVQRRHSLTSISGKGSPIQDKKPKTPWKMVRSIIGSGSGKAEQVKKKSVPPVKKPSLIEIAREEDPFLGIWMGPPEKLAPDPPKSPRSKSFEVPTSKQLEMINQGKVSRGVTSYANSKAQKLASPSQPEKPFTLECTTTNGSKWNRVRNAFMNSREENLTLDESVASMSLPSSPLRNSVLFFNEDELKGQLVPKTSLEKESSGSRSSGDWHNIQGEIQQGYQQLQRQLSQEFQLKMQSWEKEKHTVRESPGSPCLSRNVPQSTAQDLVAKSNFPPDFKKKYEQWQKLKEEPGSSNTSAVAASAVSSAVNLAGAKIQSSTSPATEKKIRARPLQQQTIQEQDLKPEFRLKVAEWEVRKALAGTSKKNVDEIRQLMPEDFNKKLQEWELKKMTPNPRDASPILSGKDKKAEMGDNSTTTVTGRRASKESSAPPPRTDLRAKSGSSSHETGIAWLERELQKLQWEKQKLEREKAKYIDREHRLEKIRTAMGKKQNLTVKTSKGEEFKFGGISEKFTRKLFEWEERRGIAPESSTIELLNSNLYGESPTSKGVMEENKLDSSGIKRSRSEGSILDPSEVGASKSMGGSDGNLSQCSLQSSKTRKSNDHIIEDSEPSQMSEEEKKLHREQCLSRHNSIRTQVNIQLLDEKINLIGSLKAHREHCQQLESTLLTLENQAVSLPQVPQEMISTIQELKKDVLSTFHYPTPQTEHHSSGFELSCCGDDSTAEQIICRKFSSPSIISRYGSESPLRSLLLPEFSQPIFDEEIEQQKPGDIKEECVILAEENLQNQEQSSGNSDSRDRISRPGSKQRRPSSDNISTPTSARSRSSSLLSSEYIPEENEEDVKKDYGRTSSSSQSSISKHSDMASNIDRLYKLVHELKEEDLNNHKRKIANRQKQQEIKATPQQQGSSNKGTSSEETSASESPRVKKHILDLHKVLVPTTSKLINAIPQCEPMSMMVERSRSPVVMELAAASLDLILAPDKKGMPSKRQSDIIVSTSSEMGQQSFERSNSEPRTSSESLRTENSSLETKAAMITRANQLKKARENFFLGNSIDSCETPEFASTTQSPLLSIEPGKSHVFRQIQKFGAMAASKYAETSTITTTSVARPGTNYLPEDITKSPIGIFPASGESSGNESWSCPPSPSTSTKKA